MSDEEILSELKRIKINYSRVNGRERFDCWEDELIALIKNLLASE